MDTIRETTLYPAKITLEARDQYNDYSVIYDHVLSVNDPKCGYYREWKVGTNREQAIACYDRAVMVIGFQQFHDGIRQGS